MAEYIERSDAIMAVTRAKLPDKTADGIPIANGKRSVTDCVRLIKEIPVANVAPIRHGHWNAKEDYNMDIYYECSICKETWTTIEGDPWDNGMSYCPHCGARMDG